MFELIGPDKDTYTIYGVDQTSFLVYDNINGWLWMPQRFFKPPTRECFPSTMVAASAKYKGQVSAS